MIFVSATGRASPAGTGELEFEGLDPRRAAERQVLDRAGRLDARNRFEALENLLVVADDDARFAITRGRRLHAHRQDALGVETRVHVLQVPERARHESRADREHQRQRDLYGDHHSARAARGTAVTRRPFAQHQGEGRASCCRRRCDAKQHRNSQRHDEDRSGDPGVYMNVAGSRCIAGQQVDDCRPGQGGHCEAGERAAAGEQKSFRQLQTDDSRSGRAERRVDRELARAGHAPRNQQRSKVRRGNQQHEEDGRAEHEKGRPDVARRCGLQILDARITSVSGRKPEVGSHARDQRFQFTVRLFERHAISEAADEH